MRRITGSLTGPRAGLWLALLALTALFLLAGATHYWLVVRGAYLLAILVAGAAAWGLLQRTGLQGRWEAGATQVVAGDEHAETFVLRNRAPWPRQLLELRFPSTLPGRSGPRAVSVRPRGEALVELRTPCHRRGRYRIGPATVRTWDPFGLWPWEGRFGAERDLLVLPRTEPLPGFEPPQRRRHAAARRLRPSPAPAPVAGSVRPYAHGDSQRLVHWPSTLRRGRLMVKTFDTDAGEPCRLLLDLGGAPTDDALELAVTVAASLAAAVAARRQPVGLSVVGGATVEASHGRAHVAQLLETLALAGTPADDAPFPAGRGAAVILVTTRGAAAQRPALDLAADGRGVAVVFVTAAPAGDAVTAARAALADAGVNTYLVYPGVPLADALQRSRTRR